MEIEDLEGSAPADSPLGQLQRGRGAGWLYAAESPSGADLLVKCLSREPRWDRQVESRAEYYATLALHLEIPPADLATPASYDLEAENNWIVRGVIEEMARRGSAAATKLTARFDRDDDPGDETDWAAARALLARRDAQLMDMPVEKLLSEFDIRFLRKAVVDRLSATMDHHEVSMLREAATDISNPGWQLAMRVLGIRGDLGPLGLAEKSIIDDEPGAIRRTAFQYVEALPGELSLPLARSWITADDGRSYVAASVLGKHAETSDAGAIREALATASDYYTVTSLVEGLGRLPEAGPFGELDQIYARSSYSYLRARAVEAMAATDPAFGTKWATECLWDSEERVRIQGATFAPADESVVHRLRQLAADSFEEPEVREAVGARLS
jgi:hypothetical protein